GFLYGEELVPEGRKTAGRSPALVIRSGQQDGVRGRADAHHTAWCLCRPAPPARFASGSLPQCRLSLRLCSPTERTPRRNLRAPRTFFSQFFPPVFRGTDPKA